MVTETDDVARALDDAAVRWPHAKTRSQLLHLLLAEGHAQVVEANAEARHARMKAITECAGALTGAYGADYLEQLREEWST